MRPETAPIPPAPHRMGFSTSPLGRFTATAVATLLVAAGISAGAIPASAASVAISAPAVPTAGGEITVTGTGFDADSTGIYLGVGPTGLSGFYAGSAQLLPNETVWIALGNPNVPSGTARTAPMNADGSFSVKLTIPAASNTIPQYAIYTSKAHGKGFSDPSQNTTTALNYHDPDPVPAVVVTPKTGLEPTGGTLAVSGTGFNATGSGFYVGVGPKAALQDPNWYRTSGYFQAVKWATPSGKYGATINPDGSFSITLANVKAVFSSNNRAVDCRTEECGVFTFASGGSADRSADTYTPLAFRNPTATTLTLVPSTSSLAEGATLSLTATLSPTNANGTVEFFEGSTSLGQAAIANGTALLTLSALAAGVHSLTAKFTPTDATTANPASASAITVTITQHTVTAPGVVVTPHTGIDPDAGVLTLTGTGFASIGSGIYLGVGPKAALNDPKWFQNAAYFQATAWASGAGTAGPKIQSDGSFTATLNGVKQSFTSHGRTVDCATEECGVFTFAAHGSTDRSQDTYTPIAFATRVPSAVETSLNLRLSAATSQPGEAVEVTATVTPASAGTITLFDRGVTVASDLRLSTGSGSGTATSSSVTTRIAGLEAGVHVLTARFTPDDATAFTPTVSDAVNHEVLATPAVLSGQPQQPQGCVARSVNGATLNWGIKTSFRNYISGGIASGWWTLSGVTYSNNQYGWGGGTGSVNTADGRGLVRFGGTVSFTGHGGVLNLVLSNLALKVTSPTSATIIADVHSSDMSGTPADFSAIPFATLALPGLGSSSAALSVSSAAATLTATGAKAFANFYDPGTVLDPVSFRLPLGSQVTCDSATAAAGSALAATGSTEANGGPIAVGLLIMAGISIMRVVRRRTRNSESA